MDKLLDMRPDPLYIHPYQVMFWEHGGTHYALSASADPAPANPRKFGRKKRPTPVRICCDHRIYSLGDYTGPDKISVGKFLSNLLQECMDPDDLKARVLHVVNRGIFKALAKDENGKSARIGDKDAISLFLAGVAGMHRSSFGNAPMAIAELAKTYAVIHPIWSYDDALYPILSKDENPGYPFSDPSKSSFAGIAAVTKKDAVEQIPEFYDEEGIRRDTTAWNWEDAAKWRIRLDLEAYAAYLKNDVLKYQLYEFRNEGRPSRSTDLSEWDRIGIWSGICGADITSNGIMHAASTWMKSPTGLVDAILNETAYFGHSETRTVTYESFVWND